MDEKYVSNQTGFKCSGSLSKQIRVKKVSTSKPYEWWLQTPPLNEVIFWTSCLAKWDVDQAR